MGVCGDLDGSLRQLEVRLVGPAAGYLNFLYNSNCCRLIPVCPPMIPVVTRTNCSFQPLNMASVREECYRTHGNTIIKAWKRAQTCVSNKAIRLNSHEAFHTSNPAKFGANAANQNDINILFLDYDGTLTNIVRNPMEATIQARM